MRPVVRVYATYHISPYYDWQGYRWHMHCRRCGQLGMRNTQARAYILARQHLNWCPAIGRQTHG